MSKLAWLSLLLMSVGMAVSLVGANLVDGTYSLDALLDLFLEPSALAASLVLGATLWALRRAVKRFYHVRAVCVLWACAVGVLCVTWLLQVCVLYSLCVCAPL